MSDYPFDVTGFIKENKSLVKKYLRKDTLGLVVDDFQDLGKDFYYQNNPIILNARAVLPEYSTLQKLEYIKCMKDIIYFAQKYVKIVSIDDGVIPFNLYDFQKDLVRKMKGHRHVIALQARQTGKTQTTALFILHYSLFTPSKTTAILANKAAQAREILARIQMSYEYLPFFLKQGVRTYNKGSMKFGNGTEIFCAASSSSSIRGRSISCVVGETKIKVRNKNTKEVEELYMYELEDRLRNTIP